MKSTDMLRNLRENFKDDLEYAKKRMRTLRHPDIKAAFKQLDKITDQCAKAGETRVTPYVYSDSTRLTADVTVTTASLKSDEVLQLLEWVEDNVGECESSEDFASNWAAQRAFHFLAPNLRLELRFELPLDGEACSRIKTGTRLIEQDTYELRCA